MATFREVIACTLVYTCAIWTFFGLKGMAIWFAMVVGTILYYEWELGRWGWKGPAIWIALLVGAYVARSGGRKALPVLPDGR